MKIMSIDDSKNMRILLRFLLENEGYDVVEAIHGQEALSKIINTKIDLFIVDINMPVMGGIEFIKNIKKIPDYQDTPIIIITTDNEENKISEGLLLGANSVIMKPFDIEKVLSLLKVLLNSTLISA